MALGAPGNVWNIAQTSVMQPSRADGCGMKNHFSKHENFYENFDVTKEKTKIVRYPNQHEINNQPTFIKLL